MSEKAIGIPCPCGTGKSLSDCCEPIVNGTTKASSPEILMCSRYTAYVLKNEDYLHKSWHQSTRPDSLEMETSLKWLRLKIVKCEVNQVEFVATYRSQGKAYKMHENSRFVFEDGRWFYVDGVMIED